MVSLSACRLSRRLPQRKLFNVDTPALCFRPDAGHESLSYEHYGAVMRKMARWKYEDFEANPILGLAVLVLFCYLESSMGNFKEFRLHSEATMTLIHKFTDQVMYRGADLLAAWVEIEMQNWWRRAYFSTPDFPRNHSFQILHPQLEAVLRTANNQTASVILILCEAHRLNTAAIVSHWHDRREYDPLTKTDGALDLETAMGTANPLKEVSLNNYVALLNAQSGKLNTWYASLSMLDLPEPCQGPCSLVTLSRAGLNIQPLRFRSHSSAMNFAYYATARAMQCTGPLESLEHEFPFEDPHAYDEAETWILMLLRIAAGVDWKECIRLNVYRIGLANLFLACVLRSRSLAIGLWVQSWLEERVNGDEFEEGNFPISQILDALRLVNRERNNRWDVFSLFQTVDDGGGSGKSGSYHSQRLRSLLVYGRCRATGKMSSYYRTIAT